MSVIDLTEDRVQHGAPVVEVVGEDAETDVGVSVAARK